MLGLVAHTFGASAGSKDKPVSEFEACLVFLVRPCLKTDNTDHKTLWLVTKHRIQRQGI